LLALIKIAEFRDAHQEIHIEGAGIAIQDGPAFFRNPENAALRFLDQPGILQIEAGPTGTIAENGLLPAGKSSCLVLRGQGKLLRQKFLGLHQRFCNAVAGQLQQWQQQGLVIRNSHSGALV
jgi:hypothetical protein